MNADTISVVLQPAVHDPPGSRDGQQKSQEYKTEEVFGQEINHVPGRGTQNFSDTDLFGSLKNIIGRQSHEAETGDENGKKRKQGKGFSELLVRCILLPVKIIQEEITEWIAGKILIPEFLNRSHL